MDLREHEDKILLVLSLVISALVGLVVVAFVVLTERLGAMLVTAGPTQRLLSPVLGSLAGGILLYRYFPSARGSGIPQTRIALVLQRGFISLRTVVGKFICSSISLGSGVALGREGPSVHIGAGIASVAGRKLGLSEENIKSLIPVGTAAAVAAAFNTPLAAVLFTLEEILADLHARVVGSVVIGAATSWIVLRLILGDEPLFHVPAYQLVHPIEFLIYALLGLCGGVISTAFVKLLLWQRAMFMKVPETWRPFAPATGGLVVGLLALVAPGVLGVGYNLVSDALNGQLAFQMMLLLLLLKIVATSTCYSSGNAGGIFGPSLFIGAMLGGAVGQVAHGWFPDHTGNAGAYALVGMGAAFAGIVRTPMTSVIMIFEVTRDYTIIVPLMLANLCSYFLAQRLQKVPIYEALAQQDGIIMPSAAHRPEPLRVETAMRRSEAGAAPHADRPTVHPDDTLDTAAQRMGEARIDQLAVISREGGHRIGSLSADDIELAYRSLSMPAKAERPPAQGQNWLPSIAAITVISVLIVSGLVVWQRTRRSDRALDAQREGTALLAQGRLDEAVAAFRNGLAHTPQNTQLRAALGLALVRTEHWTEAEFYLTGVVRADPANGPAWAGLAKVKLSEGDRMQARSLFRRGLAQEWPPAEEAARRLAQFDYAALLASTGRPNEAISLLLTMIERYGDEASDGKRAAQLVASIGTPQQAEEAGELLVKRFPADSSAWLGLGDARFAAGKDRLALDAYRQAVQADPANEAAKTAVARVETVLKLDPTIRGLPVRERARRWHELLQRTLTVTAACGPAPAIDKGTVLLRKPASVETADLKMDQVLEIWRGTAPACKTDPALTHILAKVSE